jgi:hypothetical protein
MRKRIKNNGNVRSDIKIFGHFYLFFTWEKFREIPGNSRFPDQFPFPVPVSRKTEFPGKMKSLSTN